MADVLQPTDWRSVPLSECLVDMTDYVASGSFAALKQNVTVYKNPEYAFYVRLTDLRAGLGHSDQRYVDRSGYEFLKRSNLNGGEILMASVGANVGECFLMPDGMGSATIAPNMIVLRSNDRSCSSEYLFAYLKSSFGQAAIRETIAGSGHPKISKTEAKAISVVLPPLPEQRAIAAALSDVDALIAALDRLIAKKRDIKTAAMQQLLTGRTRLPGFDGEWETRTLGEVADIVDPHPSHRAPAVDPGGIPFVGIGDVSIDGSVDTASARRVSPSVYDEHRERYRLEDGVLGLGRVASIGKVVRLDPRVGPYAVSPTLAIIRAKSIELRYLFYFLSSSEARNQFDQISSGSTRQSVGMNVLRTIVVRAPKTRSEQTAIGAILSDMDAEIAALEARREKTKQIKQGMMQELLTGRTRLVPTEQDHLEA